MIPQCVRIILQYLDQQGRTSSCVVLSLFSRFISSSSSSSSRSPIANCNPQGFPVKSVGYKTPKNTLICKGLCKYRDVSEPVNEVLYRADHLKGRGLNNFCPERKDSWLRV
jgi:hypothetical protein